MDGWTIAWLVWLAGFAIIEGAAFVKTVNGQGTLSNNVWRWFGIRSHHWTPWVVVRRVALLLFLIWLTLHLTTGWP